MINSLTCPFCGSQPKIEGLMIGTQFESYFIQCSNKECEAAIKKPFFSKEDAIAAWNIRANASLDDVIIADSVAYKNLNMKPVLKLYDEIEKKFDSKAIWVVLLLLCQIDVKTWKFPDYLRGSHLDEYLSLIENNEELKTTFNQSYNNT